MPSGEDLVTLADARNEFLQNVVGVMYTHVFGIVDKWAADVASAGGKTAEFQRKLLEIPKWNQEVVEQLSNQILVSDPEFSFLLKSLFVAWVRVMIFKRRAGAPSSVRILVPNTPKFVHAVMSHTARWVFEHPIVYKGCTSEDKTAILSSAVESAARQLLPMKDVLQLYLGENIHTDDITAALQDPEPSDSRGSADDSGAAPEPSDARDGDDGPLDPPAMGEPAMEDAPVAGDDLDQILSDESLAALQQQQEGHQVEEQRDWDRQYGSLQQQLPARGVGGLTSPQAQHAVVPAVTLPSPTVGQWPSPAAGGAGGAAVDAIAPVGAGDRPWQPALT